MADINQITEINELNLSLYRLVMRDTAAAKKAIAFVDSDRLKMELFTDGYAQATGETGVVARTDKAIQIATEALALFNTGAKQ
ncbi:DUF2560 family protein [Atlantibacter sp.]|uniref:DUF2560 family protein n=1 Tax=Atlantibacter sp. TaxID=1903473 RepID=UPI0028B0A31D|nr:DUF2560 family protein [Atlantibacter sp.]